MARPRSRGARRTSRTRARGGRGARGTTGGGIARYVIPIGVAGALLWYLMPTAQAAPRNGTTPNGGGGVPNVNVPTPTRGAPFIRARITERTRLSGAPNANGSSLSGLNVNDVVYIIPGTWRPVGEHPEWAAVITDLQLSPSGPPEANRRGWVDTRYLEDQGEIELPVTLGVGGWR